MASIDPVFQGKTFESGTPEYERASKTYAWSTYHTERPMNPASIIVPSCVEDIQWVVQNHKGKKIAIRSGGHQYSGASSSTGPENIILDLKSTFRQPDVDLRLIREGDKAYIYSSVSWHLHELYDFLQAKGVFLPTGQCVQVCVGGHVQTGGYGMLARSFGLFSDYVRELHFIDHAGQARTITKDSDPDLWYGWLGGSPGNMGVLTHFKVEVQQDVNHQGSQGLWVVFPYFKSTLQKLYDILVEKAEDAEFERNYDMTVNVLDGNHNIVDVFPGDKDEFVQNAPEGILAKLKAKIVEDAQSVIVNQPVIVVYAQWVNLGTSHFSSAFFDQIEGVASLKYVKRSQPEDGMSKIMSMWLFNRSREFPLPYNKRTLSSNANDFSKREWSKWFTGQVDKAVSDNHNGISLASQLQVMGGKHSMFWRNAGKNGSAYSWRDSTVSGTWDAFYSNKQNADAWQQENDKGIKQHFCDSERRLLWGSFGEWDMKKVWQFYHEKDSYERLRHIRKKADPNGTFTPNPFCVEAAE